MRRHNPCPNTKPWSESLEHRTKKFRIRWMRWIGQKCRDDGGGHWSKLLDCNWSSWARHVLQEHNKVVAPLTPLNSNRTAVRHYYRSAIAVATMKELISLDGIYAGDKSKL